MDDVVLLSEYYNGLRVVPNQCSDLVGMDDPVINPEPYTTLPMGPSLWTHPNPFNPSTTVSFWMEQPGTHTCQGQGRDSLGRIMPTGIYLVRMVTEGSIVSEKITLLK